jgi:hypothetical protein
MPNLKKDKSALSGQNTQTFNLKAIGACGVTENGAVI